MGYPVMANTTIYENPTSGVLATVRVGLDKAALTELLVNHIQGWGEFSPGKAEYLATDLAEFIILKSEK